MKKYLVPLLAALVYSSCSSQPQEGALSVSTPQGKVWLIPYSCGAVRVVAQRAGETAPLPDDDLFYVTRPDGKFSAVEESADELRALNGALGVVCDKRSGELTFTDADGTPIVRQTAMLPAGEGTAARATFATQPGERLYGTGQFQDGYLNVNGLSRRLTQVNTQIALPMILSSRGYGLLWNNYGLTDFNPADSVVALSAVGESGQSVEVNVTGTTGNRSERRSFRLFAADISVPDDGPYALLLDVGQAMARRHHIEVDGTVVCDAQNLWLPPTTSAIVDLRRGSHRIVVEGEQNDSPTLAWRAVDASATFSSPVADATDYTVFAGSADEVVAQYRHLTGEVPMLPRWALGYIHCRERYTSQADLLENATRFRQSGIPLDLIVQDWQYWGKYGWNAMQFDEELYPDPRAMCDSLHAMQIRLMLSVWAKVDKNSTLGHEMSAAGHYIEGRDWVDFFSPQAADAYWAAYHRQLLPSGIDAWWQDATEPENDDLHGLQVNRGQWEGDRYRNVFPLMVNRCVHGGLSREFPQTRQMILTRSAAPGIQRYGVATWSGDVGNDWSTLRRQINGGLGQMACGLPWWTYDAGGFFRPGDQYSNADYQERMLRWIEAAVFLPMMRVHGYMSRTEPWHYAPATAQAYAKNVRLRYSLLPYIYSEASQVWRSGGTLMRPLVFDFADDDAALSAADEQCLYMFGHALLVSPVTQGGVSEWSTQLPQSSGGWYHLHDGRHYPGGQRVSTAVTPDAIPVFVRAGSILPWAESEGVQSSLDVLAADTLRLRLYPGADGDFTLYEDDGLTTDGGASEIAMSWDDARRCLTLHARRGAYDAMPKQRLFVVSLPDGREKTVKYSGKRTTVEMK